MKGTRHISILGGGPAGLAVGYYARKKGIPFTLYEASSEVGGNARTLEHGGFHFDTGAHRFHDKDPEITRDILDLLGKEIRRVDSPSQIYYQGRFVDFPLSPLNLLVTLGVHTCAKAGLEVVVSRLRKKPAGSDFESFAVKNYGRTLAKAFLLDYSEKLWGRSCAELSTRISGRRIKGLTLGTFLKEVVRGKKAKTEHLDGSFYYPSRGIGMIAQEIARFCGRENIRTHSRVTRVLHDGHRVQAIEINGTEQVEVDRVAGTLPLPLFLEQMDPLPNREILNLARSLNYRDILLVAVFLNKRQVTRNASVYFPSKDCLFTRVYEPKNRSLWMAPEGKTSLIAEIPCSAGDPVWSQSDPKLVEAVCAKYVEVGWIRRPEVVGSAVLRMRYAYPILEVGYEEKSEKMFGALGKFQNLGLVGRSAQFQYTHIHDLLRAGKDLVSKLSSRQDASR